MSSTCSFKDNELYFLSFRVPAKPGIAKDLNEADAIGRKAAADFNDSLLVENLSFTTPLNLVYTYFIATNYSNGVGSQVLATLVTTLPLHIQINQSM